MDGKIQVRANRRQNCQFIELHIGNSYIKLTAQQVEALSQCLTEVKVFMDEPEHYREWEVEAHA